MDIIEKIKVDSQQRISNFEFRITQMNDRMFDSLSEISTEVMKSTKQSKQNFDQLKKEAQ